MIHEASSRKAGGESAATLSQEMGAKAYCGTLSDHFETTLPRAAHRALQ
jgi:hypothetical protein